jgi:TonB-linked SusC/RagA family outer membrane protein
MEKLKLNLKNALTCTTLLFLLCFGTGFHEVQAAVFQKSVLVRVKDELGQPIAGVTVAIMDKAAVGSTDDKGELRVAGLLPENKLILTMIGFERKIVSIGDQQVIEVQLQKQVENLNEIVVVGYGTMKKKDLSGSIEAVQGKAINDRGVNQLSQALQGQTAGLNVTRSNGAPGSSATIRLRGITSIGDSNPLILVDGIQVASIDAVNPADVDNISVLKDASSASIYGSKAAAGVILITTKRGKSGRSNFDLQYYTGFDKPSNLPKSVDAVRYMKMVNELTWNDAGNANQYSVYPKDMVDNYTTLHAQNPDQYPDTDWQDLILKDYANRNSYLLNFMAGSESVQSRVSLGYDDSKGLYIGKGYKRITARVNTDIKLTNNLKSTIDINFLKNKYTDPSESPITTMYRAAPVYAALWSDGRIAEGKGGNNIYGQILNGGYNDLWENQLSGRASLVYEPLKDLRLTAVLAPTMNFNKGKEFRKRVTYTAYDNPATVLGTTDWGGVNRLNERRVDSYNITSQLLANYTFSKSDHNFDVLAGFENYSFFYESISASSSNMTLDSYPYLDLGNINNLISGGNAYENASTSVFGRLSYNYRNKYYLQGNIRADASSRFHKDYRWGTFPSISAAWVLTQEDFLKSNKVLSFLKIRGSYGILGNERIGNYPYQSIINFADALLFNGSNVVSVQTAAQQAYAIQNITWEKTKTANIGVDANFLKDRLQFNLDIYQKETSDMLLALEIPAFMGYAKPDQNAGYMNTKGWEFVTKYQDEVGELKYSVSANLSDSRSKMGDLGGIQFLGNKVKFQGSEFDEWFGYKSLGIYQTAAQVAGSPALNAGLKPGDIQYQDISGPNGTPDGIISEYDKVLLGGSQPRFLYGGSINLDYKGFDFGLGFQGVGKQTSQLTSNMIQPYLGSWGTLPYEVDGNYWSNYQTPEQNLKAKYPRLSNVSTTNNYAMSDFWLFNGSYFRVKNITLGYTLPKTVNDKLKISNCRIYAIATDIFTKSRYPSGWDPEVSNTGYPITSSVNLGISLRF